MGLLAGLSSTAGTLALGGGFLVEIMSAAAAASAAAVGDVVATPAAGVERAVALATALLVGLLAGLSSTSGTIAFGGGFLAEIMSTAAAASAASVGDVVATAAAGVERKRAIVLPVTLLVDWRRGELSPTAGTVAAFWWALLVTMTDV